MAASSVQAGPPAFDSRISSADTFLYCWQHKDQAFTQSQQHNGHEPAGALPTLQERTSIDTLVERLGGLDVKSKGRKGTKPTRKPENHLNDLHAGHQGGADHGRTHKASSTPAPAARPKQRQSFWASLCCMGEEEDDDYIEIVRHRKRSEAARRPKQEQDMTMPVRHNSTPQNPHSAGHGSTNQQSPPIMSYIPDSLAPQAASVLFAELTKPISSFDEPGYIYIFWLTDSAMAAPSNDDTSSLLAPLSSSGNISAQNERRRSDVLRQYSTSKPSGRRAERTSVQSGTPATRCGADTAAGRTILLKIGRASNVHRRMNEWTRQCGFNVSLVRFYPYISTSSLRQSSPSPSPQPSSPPPRPAPCPAREPLSPPLDDGGAIRKVPYSHRVERLVHIELAARGLRAPAGPSDHSGTRGNGKCAACGREHREWFEVEATREALKTVNEVIGRWVRWAETAQRDERRKGMS